MQIHFRRRRWIETIKPQPKTACTKMSLEKKKEKRTVIPQPHTYIHLHFRDRTLQALKSKLEVGGCATQRSWNINMPKRKEQLSFRLLCRLPLRRSTLVCVVGSSRTRSRLYAIWSSPLKPLTFLNSLDLWSFIITRKYALREPPPPPSADDFPFTKKRNAWQGVLRTSFFPFCVLYGIENVNGVTTN